MPDFPIIDSHVHLYDPGRIRYGWMRGSKLDAPHLLPDLEAARGAVEIAGIVWIEVGADPGQHDAECDADEPGDAESRGARGRHDLGRHGGILSPVPVGRKHRPLAWLAS